jgi:hypothetical protein
VAALLVENNPQMPPCCICVRMAALLVEKIRKCRRRVLVAALLVENNPQMPPCCCSGGITG